jgi:hypothetical protein
MEITNMHLLIPLLSALFGAVVGGISLIAANAVQARFENKRVRARLAVEAAIQEYKQHVEMAGGRGVWIPPLSTFVYYNSRVIELLEKGRLTATTLQRLGQEVEEMLEAIPRRGPGPPYKTETKQNE